MRFSKWNLIAAASALLALAGCTVGPKYQRASVPTPPTWSAEAPWRAAEPKDGIPKGAWWILYEDPVLTQFEQTALDANQSIQLATTRVEQARDLARVQVAGFFPSLTANPSAARQRLSANRPAVGPPPDGTDPSIGSWRIPKSVSMVLQRAQR